MTTIKKGATSVQVGPMPSEDGCKCRSCRKPHPTKTMTRIEVGTIDVDLCSECFISLLLQAKDWHSRMPK